MDNPNFYCGCYRSYPGIHREKAMTRAEAGRIGGTMTLTRHGKEYYAHLGKTYGSKGGRPRTILTQRQPSQYVEGGKLPGELKTLKEMCRKFLEEGGFSREVSLVSQEVIRTETK